jgi:hypothetical protein
MHNRNQQDLLWFEETILQELQNVFSNDNSVQSVKEGLKQKIKNNEITAVNAAKFLVQKFIEK